MLKAQTIRELPAIDAHEIIINLNSSKDVLIDGRSQAMFEDAHIQNAVNIDAFASDLNSKLKPYLSKERIVVYCTNQNRSLKLIDALSLLKYQGEILFVNDGINGWKANHFETVSGAEIVHEIQSEMPEKQKLKPIVQVFGTASYDIDNQFYNYSFGRAHLGLAYKFNEKYSAKIVIDKGAPTTLNEILVTDSVGNPMSVNVDVANGSQYTMWLKFASLKWQVNKDLSFEAGAVLQNHFLVQERFWNYRFVAQTFQDKYWNIPATDLGFIARYKINDFVAVDAALTNGEGPRIAQDINGNVKLAGGVDVYPVDWLSFRLYYHHKASEFPGNTEQLFSGFVGFKPFEKFRLGAEFNYMLGLNNINEFNSYGFSAYSSYRFYENWELFGRYAMLMFDSPVSLTSSFESGNAIFGGIVYHPMNQISVSLNYQGFLPDDTASALLSFMNFSMEFKF